VQSDHPIRAGGIEHRQQLLQYRPHQPAVIAQVMLQGSLDTPLEEGSRGCSIPA
jgi:hypothetical protein